LTEIDTSVQPIPIRKFSHHQHLPVGIGGKKSCEWRFQGTTGAFIYYRTSSPVLALIRKRSIFHSLVLLRRLMFQGSSVIAVASHAGGMAKKREPIDDMIDAHVWMRRRNGKRAQTRPAPYLAVSRV
jgi:hypothetical protein